MGNEIVKQELPEEEPEWRLPSENEDEDWVRAAMEQVFDDEVLRKHFGMSDVGMERLVKQTQRQAWAVRVSNAGQDEEISTQEAENIADAVDCFANVENPDAKQRLVSRLSSSLSSECREEDSFNQKVAQRVHYLKAIYKALSRKWPRGITETSGMARDQDDNIKSSNGASSRLYSPVVSNNSSAPTPRRLRRRRKIDNHENGQVKTSKNTSFSLQLGLDLFFTTSKCISRENICTAEQYTSIVREMIPFISLLARSENSTIYETNTEISMVTDQICEFLFYASIGVMPSNSKLRSIEGEPLQISAQERCQALEALMLLANSRGKLGDYLLCAKALLMESTLNETETTPFVNALPSRDTSFNASEKLMNSQSGGNKVEDVETSRQREMLAQAKRSAKANTFESLEVREPLKKLCEVDGTRLFTMQLLGGLPEQVELWSCGQNSYGELAHGDTITRKTLKNAVVLSGNDVIQVVAGNEHTILLTSDRKVYAVGYNDNGQCGQGNNGRVAHLSNIEFFNGKNIVKVHAYNGCEHTLCVSEDGKLYSFGYNYRGQLGVNCTSSIYTPTAVPGFGPGKRVQHVSCSYYHSIISTHEGELYVFGRNDFGQLGIGDTLDRKEPTKVVVPEKSEDDSFIALACGQYHTVIATSNGHIFATGKNDYGQLGLKLSEPHRKFTSLRPLSSDINILDVKCGYYHTLVLTTDGELWSFGRNDYGQLGIGVSNHKLFTPRRVESFNSKQVFIKRIAAGCYHSIAIDQNSIVYTFGRNNHGQLGCGESAEKHTPFPIKLFLGKRIADVAAGFYHTIVLTGGEEEQGEVEAIADDSDSPQVPKAIRSAKNVLKNLAQKHWQDFSANSNAVTPMNAAIIIFSNLERLGRIFQHRQKKTHKNIRYPPISQSLPLPNPEIPYCTSPDPEVFANLVSIASICQGHLTSDACYNDLVVWSYLFHACLKVLERNLAHMFWSGQAKMIVAEIRRSPHSRVVKGVLDLHQYLLDLIDHPPTMFSTGCVDLVLATASEILMVGLELFYPTQELQVQLLASLMNDSETMPAMSSARSPRSPLMKFYTPTILSSNVRATLLTPLLTRLADDELVAKLIPARVWSHNMGNQLDHDASVALLSSLLKSLVQQISSTKNPTFSKLLYSLQKHLLSWAGEENFVSIDLDRFTGYVDDAISNMKFGEPVEMDHSYFAWNVKTPRSSAWYCVLQYIDLVFRKTNEELKEPLDEASVWSTIAISLVTGLMLFSGSTMVATKILPKITETLRIVDRACAASKRVLDADKEYREWSNENAGNALKMELSSPIKLPLLLEFEKSLATLGGRMAATLVQSLVEGEQQLIQSLAGTEILGDYIYWQQSQLFVGGFDGLSPQVEDSMIEQLRDFTGKANFVYRVSLMQGKANGDADAMDRAEVATFLAMVKQTDTVQEAKTFQYPTKSRKLMFCWKIATELRMRLVRIRSEFLAQEDGENQFQPLCGEMTKRAKLLALFGVDEPVFSGSRKVIKPNHRHWRRLRLMIRTICRFKSMLNFDFSGIGLAVTQFVHEPSGAGKRNSDAADSVTDQVSVSNSAISFSLGTLVLMLSNNIRRAGLRHMGFESFKTLMASPTLCSPRTDILRYLTPALRCEASTTGTFYGVNTTLKENVRMSFMNLYADLAILMKKVFSTEGCSCASEQLLLLDAWALTLKSDDIQLLATTGVLSTIQSVLMKDRENRSEFSNKPIGRAAWSLFRLLVAQVGESVEESQVGKLLQILFTEIEKSLVLFENKESKERRPSTPPQSTNLFVDEAKSISSIRGVVYNPVKTGMDFSITMWLYVERSSHGVIFMRGSTVEPSCRLLCALNQNRKLEVWLLDENGNEAEHMWSKDPIEDAAWSHLTLVWDNGRLSMFVNGVLHAQQQQMYPHIRFMDEALILGGDRIDGYMGQVKFHPRALSPIHIMVLFDQGAPELKCAEDRQCFQLLVIVQNLCRNSAAKAVLSEARWLALEAKLLQNGTARVQQVIVRIWRQLFPINNPVYIARCVLPQLFGTRESFSGEDFVDYLLVHVGLGMWHLNVKKPDSVAAAPSATPRKMKPVKQDPNSKAPELSTTPSIRSNLDMILGFESNEALSDELVMLLRLLCDNEQWNDVIGQRMTAGMGDIAEGSLEKSDVIDDVGTLRGLGTLAVLGGHAEDFRMGGMVAMTHADITATVVGYDSTATHPNTALVVMTPVSSKKSVSDNEDSTSKADGTQNKPSTKALRMNLEELVPVSEYKTPYATLSPKKRTRSKKGESMFDDEEEKAEDPTKSNFEKSFFRLLERLFNTNTSSTSSFLLAQCKARTLKALHEMLHDNDCQFDELFFTNRNGNLVQSLVRLATEHVSGSKLSTLATTEIRAVELRKRMHQLRVGKQSFHEDANGAESPADEFQDDSDLIDQQVEDEDDEDDEDEEKESDDDMHHPGSFNNDLSDEEEGQFSANLSDDDDDEDGNGNMFRGREAISRVDNPPIQLVEELVSMGFPEEWCMIALRLQGNDLIGASAWIVDNLDMLSTTPLHELMAFQRGTTATSSAAEEKKDESDDKGLTDLDPVDVEYDDKEFASPTTNSKRIMDQSIAKAKSIMTDGPVPMWSQLESNVGSQVFDGEEFKADACASYEYGYLCGALSLHNSLNPGASSSRHNIRADVQELRGDKLNRLCLKVERNLTILYSRSIVLILLQKWRQWPVSTPVSFSVLDSSRRLLMDFFKLTLFRGPQIVPVLDKQSSVVSDIISNLEDLPTGRTMLPPTEGSLAESHVREILLPVTIGGTADNHLLPDSKQKKRTGQFHKNLVPDAAASSILSLLLTAIRPGLEQMIRENPSSPYCMVLIDSCILGLEDAAKDPERVDTLWGMRDCSMSDEVALQPSNNVELCAWLLSIFLVESCPAVYSEAVFERVAKLLSSPNMPLKSIALHILCIILRHGNVSESVARIVPYERLEIIAQERLEFEDRSGKATYSKYVSSIVELLSLLPKPVTHSNKTYNGLISPVADDVVVQGLVDVKSTEDTLTFAWYLVDPSSSFIVQLFKDDGLIYSIETKNQLVRFKNLLSNTAYTVNVHVLGSGGLGPATSASATTLDTFPYVFDPCRCGPNIRIAQSSASYSAMESWSTVMSKRGFSCGVNTWYIRIDASDSPYLFVGVANRHACLTTFLGGDANSWGYIGDRAFYHKRNRLNVYGERFGQGDIIGVTLDMEHGGVMSFSRNGKDLGVAVEGLSGCLYPAVSFYGGNQKVSFLKKSLPVIGSSDAVPHSHLSIRESVNSLKILQGDFSDDAFEVYKSLGVRVRELTFHDVGIDFSRKYEGKKFVFGQKLQVSSGATVTALGEYHGRFWVKYEDSGRCWYTDPDTCKIITEQPAREEMAEPKNLLSKNSFKEIMEQSSDDFTDKQIVREMNYASYQNGIAPFSLTSEQLARVLENLRQDINLQIDEQVFRVRVARIMAWNNLVSKLLPYATEHATFGAHDLLDLGVSRVKYGTRQNISHFVQRNREMIFSQIKRQLLERSLVASATAPVRAEDDYEYPSNLPQLELNRPRAAFSRSMNDMESRLSFSIFGQTFDELHFMEPKSLRLMYSHPMDEGQYRVFRVRFVGEGSEDYGGPYRDVFGDISSELTAIENQGESQAPTRFNKEDMRCVLPILLPSPNQRHEIGADREKFIIKPTSSLPGSSMHLLLEMYNFLGQLVGIAMRTRVHLNLNLASCVWKMLSGEKPNIEDLKRYDQTAAYLVESLLYDPQVVVDDLFWSTILSDGSTVELIPGGKETRVTRDEYASYAKCVLEVRLNESSRFVSAIRDGLLSVVPAGVLAQFSAEELEYVVCGTKTVDVDLLQSCTDYDDDVSPNDPHIQNFWKVLRGFDVANRSKFLKFVWARSTLPATAAEFSQKFKIQSCSVEGAKESPDTWLPKAHTCFFALALPKYSTATIMEEKLLYAINNCVEMDADFRVTEAETTWDDPTMST